MIPPIRLAMQGDADAIDTLLLDAVADGRPLPALALAPLAVRPERQRTGIGSALVRSALERAGAAAVFVTPFGLSETV